MRFSDFLREQKEKHAVLAFGRLNPITNGHEKLVNKVKELATKVGGSHHIVLSHSQDSKKNPLTVDQKVKHAKRAFPGTNFIAASSKAPTFFDHAEALYKKGVTHLHMIGGSDRVGEYEKLLNKYNGTQKGARFNFKSIEVHSAGERDPDAEGVTGISASKMREAAKEGDFDTFKKGAPSTMSVAQAKQMYNDVRKGMRLHEEILREGVHDKGIFKAVFLAGGPGSGKDYVLDNTLAGHGMTEMNSDKALEFLMDKEGLDKKMPASEEDKKNIVRSRAKNITELRQRLAILGRNGLIINGTGDDVEKIAKIKKELESVGYESSMMLVNTADEVSKQRNIERGQRGGRTVPENIRKEKWDAVQAGRPEFAKMFGDNYMEFDNSEDLRTAPPEVVNAKKEEMLQMFSRIKEFVSVPPKNPMADSWVAMELQKKDTLPVPKNGAEQTPHSDSGAAEEARKIGLKYYGFGRYGQNGVVTHRSVHDKLIEVEKTPQKEPNVPTSGSSMKRTNVKEEIDQEFESLLEEKKVKLLRGNDGKPRIFLIRRSAAKETHIRGGEVMKHPKGYVIKIKEENDNVEITKEFFSQSEKTRNTYRTTSVRITEGRISNYGIESGNYNRTPAAGTIGVNSTEQGNGEATPIKTKITLDKIRAKQKEAKQKYQESIDRGIEPGLSMAASGENMLRGLTKTKLIKKPLEELTGDETTMSIGDQKELELKRKGINLSSFKAKKFL